MRGPVSHPTGPRFRSRTVDLQFRHAYLRPELARRRAVGCCTRVIVLLAGIERVAGALAVRHYQPYMGCQARRDGERAQVQLPRGRTERAAREGIRLTGVRHLVPGVRRAVGRCAVAREDLEGLQRTEPVL